MPSFGISAFLRIVHMNPRPQRSELRRRFTPREGGYDFHSSLRRLAHRLLVEGESFENVLTATAAILCLRTMRLIRLGNAAEVAPLGLLIARSIDGIFREVEREVREPSPGPTDQPLVPSAE
jgi:hypothetical protein